LTLPLAHASASGSYSHIDGNDILSISPDKLKSLEGEASYTDLKKKWCDSFEREYLVGILNKNAGNVSAAAREARLDRSNFLRLLRRHGLRAQEYRKAA
jgi:transcriptional regulator of acetoin/glycerol metabolism